MNGKWEKPRIFPSVNPAQPCFIGFSFSLDVLPPLTYDKIILSIAAVLSFFVLLGAVVPAASCHAAQRIPVVERLRVE